MDLDFLHERGLVNENSKNHQAAFCIKFGKIGTASRDAFEERSPAFMIAELVKNASVKADMTQAELAPKRNVNRAYISKIERAGSGIRVLTQKK